MVSFKMVSFEMRMIGISTAREDSAPKQLLAKQHSKSE